MKYPKRNRPMSIALGLYMHTEPLFSGEFQCEGLDLKRLTVGPTELFRRAIETREFEACEMSLSAHIIGKSRGNWPFSGIPVFPSRTFRHSLFFINADARIERPEDLRGKRVGVPEYHMTAALFSRGVLWDDFGIAASDINWVQAGMWEAGRTERIDLDLPSDIRLVVEREKCLEDMIVSGEIDALVGPHIPRSYVSNPHGGPVRRLFPDSIEAELDWYSRTHVFPIMHMVVIRNDVIDTDPWIAASLIRGFEQAKKLALRRLAVEGSSAVPLPFLKHEMMRTREWFGEDFWPYGVTANQHVLNTACRYAFEQGLTARLVSPDELFLA